MRVMLTVDDEVFERYKDNAKQAGNLKPEQIMTNYISKMAHVDFNSRFLLLNTEQTKRIESLLGIHATSAADLVEKLSTLASIQIGDMKLELSVGELAEIKLAALNYGMPIQAYFIDCLFNAGIVSSPQAIHSVESVG